VHLLSILPPASDLRKNGIRRAITAQQATLTLHRLRQALMKMRPKTNTLRGLLYEFGVTFAKGVKALLSEIASALEALASTLPQEVVDSLREQVNRIKVPEADMVTIETRLKLQLKQDPQMQRIAKIPGLGLLTASRLTRIRFLAPNSSHSPNRSPTSTPSVDASATSTVTVGLAVPFSIRER
jgi:transposase